MTNVQQFREGSGFRIQVPGVDTDVEEARKWAGTPKE